MTTAPHASREIDDHNPGVRRWLPEATTEEPAR